MSIDQSISQSKDVCIWPYVANESRSHTCQSVRHVTLFFFGSFNKTFALLIYIFIRQTKQKQHTDNNRQKDTHSGLKAK